ncbi:Histone-lysine N-methyltransferase NSD3 [Hordeum vulgare]|nr:Histone-lysine N-methyltransferase NSD3 [Hordeum vulgare]
MRRGMQGVRLAGVLIVETDVYVKPTHTRIGIACVDGISSRLDAEFTAVRQDKDAASRDREWATSRRGEVDASSRLDVVFGYCSLMASSGKMEGPSAPALRRDPYEVLSVSRDSSDQEINSAYRKLALKFVPRPLVPSPWHHDSNMKYHVKEPHVSAFNIATTYQGSYLANSDGHKDALRERNDPALYTGADDRSSAYNSSIEEMTKMYAHVRAGDVYSPQGARYDQIGSSGARYGQSSLTSPSYGLLSTTQARSSVMDKCGPGLGSGGSGPSVMNNYAPGYLGANAPRSSEMDRHAPPLDQTNYTVRGVHDVSGYGRDVPPQYPYRGPHPSGRGPPHI